jgi:hypothetical protein
MENPYSTHIHTCMHASQVDDEVMLIESVEGRTLIVRRGQSGTAASTHSNGAIISLRIDTNSLTQDTTTIPALPGAVRGDAVTGYTQDPALNVRAVWQSTPAPNAINTITVSLAANVHLLPGPPSLVTVSGLTGARTPDSGLTTVVLQSGAGVSATDTVIGFAAPADVPIQIGSYIQVDNEIMLITGEDTTAIQRHLVSPSVSASSLSVGQLVQIDQEIMRITALDVSTNNTVYVTRGILGTAAASHPARTTIRILEGTELTANIDSATTSIQIGSAAAIGAAAGMYVQIDSEIMVVTSVSGDTTLTVVRGRADTTPASHAMNVFVYKTWSTNINQIGGFPSNIDTIEKSVGFVTVVSVRAARIGVGAYLQVNSEYLRVESVSENTLQVR